MKKIREKKSPKLFSNHSEKCLHKLNRTLPENWKILAQFLKRISQMDINYEKKNDSQKKISWIIILANFQQMKKNYIYIKIIMQESRKKWNYRDENFWECEFSVFSWKKISCEIFRSNLVKFSNFAIFSIK